jgi:hypothetical protein
MEQENTTPGQPSFEERRAQRQRDYQAKIDANKADMAILLTPPPEKGEEEALETALMRQSHALDRLFARTMMESAETGRIEKVLLAMRMQQQCRETALALARIQRTKSLTTRTEAINNARNPGKQTDSDGRLYNAEGRLIYDFTGTEDAAVRE